jgi:hypothetical protein
MQLLDQLYKAALYSAPTNVANTRRNQRETIFAVGKTVYTFGLNVVYPIIYLLSWMS